MIFLFITLSLGTILKVPMGGSFYNLQFSELILMLLFFIICLKTWKKGTIRKPSGFKMIFYVLWFLCFIYSIIDFYWSSSAMTSLTGSLVLFYGLIGFMVAEHFYSINPNSFIIANRILIISLFVQLLINMASLIHSYGDAFYQIKHQSSTLIGDSNFIAFYFTFTFLYELIAKNKRWLFYTLICLFAVVLTLSRGAIISIVVSLAIYLVLIIFNRNIKKSGSIISIGTLGLLFYLFINYTTPGMALWSGLNEGLGSHTIYARNILWDEAIAQIQQNPFGHGVIWIDDPHNIALRAWRDLGLGFGTIFLLLIAYPLYNIFRLRTLRFSNKSIAVLIGYLSVFVHAMVEPFYLSTTSIIWVVMLISFLEKTIKEEKLLVKQNAISQVKKSIKIGKYRIVK